jgi:DNA recombination protein RmuC
MKMLDEQRAQAEKLRAEAQQRHAEDMARVKDAYDKQLAQVKSASDKQIETLKEMNKKQVEDQMALIREQMRTTSETVLKERQEELGKKNMEQVSKIVDPLQQSLKMMREALDDSKEKHQEALHKLDATIQANMKNSADLGETAARLTRALTGEVKVQGNFGELKLKQLLEDLGLKDGEQFSSQEHLRDSLGKAIKDDEGKGLIPDFVLHFPNNRDVVVDSKMSFTAYERYINSEDPMEQTQCLKEHLISVRAQVDRLAKKDYSKYLKEGYNKLNFVIMYIHTEGALNLALLNDGSLWREAYDKGVLILGPQTMYMNLRILELMWTQVRQLNNQEEMMKAANMIISRTQDFAIRFAEVESRMRDTVKSIDKLKITTSESGASIITAAKNLIKAGGREDKKKKGLDDPAASMFLDSDAKWTDY